MHSRFTFHEFSFRTTVLGLILAALLLPWPVLADGPARLYLQNMPLQDEKLLVVNVLLADVVDLYAADIQLRYDPAQLQVRDDNARLEGIQIAPGPLLAFDDRFVATNRVEPESGLIHFVFTLLRPAPPIKGEGVLATIVFEIVGDGPFTVTVVDARLVSADSEALPVTFEDFRLAVDVAAEARPDTAPAPPSRSIAPDWRWWGGLILLVGALTVLLFLILRPYLMQTSPASTIAPVSPARTMPGAGRSSERSAGLLTRQGQHLLEQGNVQAAYELFSRAIELDPANVDAWLGKGMVAQDETERRICFQRVLALDPDNAEAKKALERS